MRWLGDKPMGEVANEGHKQNLYRVAQKIERCSCVFMKWLCNNGHNDLHDARDVELCPGQDNDQE